MLLSTHAHINLNWQVFDFAIFTALKTSPKFPQYNVLNFATFSPLLKILFLPYSTSIGGMSLTFQQSSYYMHMEHITSGNTIFTCQHLYSSILTRDGSLRHVNVDTVSGSTGM